jgi:hypothetical protein
VLGTIGAVLAVPLTLFAKALLVDVDPRLRWADAILGSTTTARRNAAVSPDSTAPGDTPSGDTRPDEPDGPSASGAGSVMMDVSPRDRPDPGPRT